MVKQKIRRQISHPKIKEYISPLPNHILKRVGGHTLTGLFYLRMQPIRIDSHLPSLFHRSRQGLLPDFEAQAGEGFDSFYFVLCEVHF